MWYFAPFFLILALSGLALGAPAQENELKITSIDVCKPVTVVISILSQIQAPATSFCSSFISIPVKTITSATTKTSIPKPITITSTVTITPRVSVLATATITVAHAKRNIIPALAERNIPIPSYLTAFASSEISTACSCLSIIPSTTTVKATTTVIGSGSTIVVQSTITAAPVTVTVTVTTSATVISSSKVIALTTVTSSSSKTTILSTIPSSSKTVGISSTVLASSTILSSTKIVTTSSNIPKSSSKVNVTSSTVAFSSTVPVSSTTPASSTIPATTTVSTSPTLTNCANSLPTFIIKLGNSVEFNGEELQGTYDQITSSDNGLAFNGLNNTSFATVLSLTSEGFLEIEETGIIGFVAPPLPVPQAIFFAPQSNGIVCSVATGVLMCSSSAGGTVQSVLQLCPATDASGEDVLFLGPVLGANCVDGGFEIVPICTVPVGVPTSTAGPATTTMIPASSTFPVLSTILTTTTFAISSTAPATATAPASPTLTCFVINAADDPLGDYDAFSDNSQFLVFNDEHDIFAATMLSLTPDGTLGIPSQGIIATFDTDPGSDNLVQSIVFGDFSESYISCSIATGVLTCSATGDDGTVSSQLQLCPDSSDSGYDLSIGLSVSAGCSAPNLDVVVLDCSTPWKSLKG